MIIENHLEPRNRRDFAARGGGPHEQGEVSKEDCARHPADDAMAHPFRERHQHHQRRRSPAVTALTVLSGGAVVLLYGFLIGSLTEPVAGMPGSVAGSSWSVLLVIVTAVVATLVRVHRAPRHPSRAEDRSEECAYMETVLFQPIEHMRDETEETRLPEPSPLGAAASTASADNLGSALDQFPSEAIVTLPPETRSSPSVRIRA